MTQATIIKCSTITLAMWAHRLTKLDNLGLIANQACHLMGGIVSRFQVRILHFQLNLSLRMVEGLPQWQSWSHKYWWAILQTTITSTQLMEIMKHLLHVAAGRPVIHLSLDQRGEVQGKPSILIQIWNSRHEKKSRDEHEKKSKKKKHKKSR